jgi:hypothetical protein
MTQREQRDLIPAYAGISTGLVSAQIGKYGFWGKKFARQAAKDFKAQAAENRQSATKLQGVVDAIRKNPKRNPLPEHSKITAFMESFKKTHPELVSNYGIGMAARNLEYAKKLERIVAGYGDVESTLLGHVKKYKKKGLGYKTLARAGVTGAIALPTAGIATTAYLRHRRKRRLEKKANVYPPQQVVGNYPQAPRSYPRIPPGFELITRRPTRDETERRVGKTLAAGVATGGIGYILGKYLARRVEARGGSKKDLGKLYKALPWLAAATIPAAVLLARSISGSSPTSELRRIPRGDPGLQSGDRRLAEGYDPHSSPLSPGRMLPTRPPGPRVVPLGVERGGYPTGHPSDALDRYRYRGDPARHPGA